MAKRKEKEHLDSEGEGGVPTEPAPEATTALEGDAAPQPAPESAPEPTPGPTPGPAPERRPVEEWRDRLGTPAWLFQASKFKYRWPLGLALTEEEYKKAIEAVSKEVIG